MRSRDQRTPHGYQIPFTASELDPSSTVRDVRQIDRVVRPGCQLPDLRGTRVSAIGVRSRVLRAPAFRPPGREGQPGLP